jgi:hypothetical protein
MKRRLYFVLPDLEIARQVEKELLLARVEAGCIRFLGKQGTDLGDLPEATIAQKTDLVHGIQVGLFAGAATGVLIGLIIYFFPEIHGLPVGQELGIIFICALVGGLFGAWAAGMIGSSIPSVRLKAFQKTMDEGHILLILDVPKERVEEVREIILSHHPDVEDRGMDPTIPIFP